MQRLKLYILYFALTYGVASAQYLSNPSFEGQRGMSLVPPSWTTCDPYSTPDTQPFVNSVTNSPTDGAAFVSLVGRGAPADNADHAEDCESKLLSPLLKGKCYKFKIDACCSKSYSIDVFGDVYFYTEPLLIKIYGEVNSCGKEELLFQSSTIDNTDWKTLEFTFIPKQDLNYIYIQSDFTRSPSYFGNVLLDNIRLTDDKIDDFVKLDTILDYNSTITLHATPGAVAYNWSPAGLMSCDACPDPAATFITPSTYTAEITDANFCYNHKEYFKIGIRPFIPNIITPDGDGKNDAFRILGLEPNSSLLISNRQGEVLYETDNYDNSWNGMYKGNLLPPDTYWYILQAPSMKEKMVGFVYLKQTK